MEIWRAGAPITATSQADARAVEAEGWDGQMFMDSQSLSLDPYVAMSFWAAATERLKLSTGVTNPYTRDISVTASSIASVQAVSGGRAVLGIGRGDSALAYLGLAPFRLAAFGGVLEDLQKLLSRQAIPFRDSVAEGAVALDTVALAARPDDTALRWLPEDLPKVPLSVAATGPKLIAIAAPIAEQVTFSVGAIPERVEWALDLARRAREECGLTESGVSYGAQVVVACHPDRDTAYERARRVAVSLARFQVIQGSAAGPATENDRQNFEAIRTNYDMTAHSSQTKDRLAGVELDRAFVDRFAIAGPPDYCIERLQALGRLGLDRFVCVGPSANPESWGENRHLFVREVMPALQAA